MKDGFIKVACITPKVRVADVTYNVKQIQEAMEASAKAGGYDRGIPGTLHYRIFLP